MARRITRVAIGAAGVAAAIGAAAWVMVPAERFVFGLAPISPTEAVLATRRNDDDSTRYWAQLVDDRGAVRWSTELSPHQIHEALGFTAIAASDDRIALLVDVDTAPAVLGLDRATGARRWQTPLVRGGETGIIGPTLLVDAPRVYAMQRRVPGSQGRAITALALGDGALLWASDDDAIAGASDQPRVVLIGPGRLAVATRFAHEGVVLDGATGAILGPLPMRALGCETPMSLVGVDDVDVVALPREPADAAARRVTIGGDARPSPDGPCGAVGSDIVVGTTAGDGSPGLVRLDPSSGTTRWSLALGPGLFGEWESDAGGLPRMVPVVSFGHDDVAPSEGRTTIVDLERGVVISQHEHDDHRMAVVTEQRAFVWAVFSGTIYALDPETGALGRATRLAGVSGQELRPQDFRFGAAWLSSMGWGRPDALAWAVYDLSTAAVRHASGDVVASDVTTAGWSRPR